MCGILGFNWEDEKKVRTLAELLRHRGPEQEGFHVADGVSIGHKRLKIIDLSEKGRQPLYNEDKTICITYNGEAFNFEDLKKELQKAGHTFVSRTDTEVLVHGYEQWGVDILKKIDAEFAFCIFDKKKNIFFLARDHVGVHPLYYYDDGKNFIFGSELKVFFKSDIEKKIHKKALDYYMLFGNTPSDQSILQNIKPLSPGSYLIYDLTARKIKEYERYWTVSFSPDNGVSEAEFQSEIVSRLDASVKRRMISDVPLGAFLSGGVDSSIVVSLMRKYVSDLNTFSIRFDYPDYNESQYAKVVSDLFKTTHHEIEFNANAVRELIEQLPYIYDEPFGDPSMIPTCLVSRVARQHVTVSLSGTGGDELFGGYPHYVEFEALKSLNQMPAPIKSALACSVNFVNVFLKNDRLNKLTTFLGSLEEDWSLYLKLFSYMFRTRDESRRLLDEFSDLSAYFKYDDDLANMSNHDINEYLPGCLLVKEDRASMAVSLEVRVPFLERSMIELAAIIPSKFKIRGRDKKHILKKAFSSVLPREILYRKKQGFGVPIVHYFRKELKDLACGEIFDFDLYDYYDKDFVRKMWDRHQAGLSDYSRLFWSIMMFNLWFRKWLV
ncbi:MAG: asparagine synthase (glutamine-hydrolyzing) [Sedimentisphaerales bacterium]|nr:asparagine synthase (glutamine-hydrolyzing) [Sedimentisphaerales bacterium]